MIVAHAGLTARVEHRDNALHVVVEDLLHGIHTERHAAMLCEGGELWADVGGGYPATAEELVHDLIPR